MSLLFRFDITEDSLFGTSTMERSYDGSVSHSIHQKLSKSSITEQRYANATTDLLWENKHSMASGATEIEHVNFSMIHVFTHIPHQNESQKMQLFTWAGYELTLIDKTAIDKDDTAKLKAELYALSGDDIDTVHYTLEEWRGIREGNFMPIQSDAEVAESERRRLSLLEGVEEFCSEYNNITSGSGEVQFAIFGMELWVSQIVDTINEGNSFLDLIKAVTGYDSTTVAQDPLVVIPDFLELDLGFKTSLGFGWDYEAREGATASETPSDTMANCPVAFRLADRLLPNTINAEAQQIVMDCCKVWVDAQKDCSKTLATANKEANACLKEKDFCTKAKASGSKLSALTGTKIYEWDDGAPPTLDEIIKFVLFFVDTDWSEIEDDITSIYNLFLGSDLLDDTCATGDSVLLDYIVTAAKKGVASAGKGQAPIYDDIEQLVGFAKELSKIVERAQYDDYKSNSKTGACKMKSGWPVVFQFDIEFDFGFTEKGLKDLCKLLGSARFVHSLSLW